MASPEPQGLVSYLLGGFMVLLTGVFEYYRREFETVKKTYVSQEDFATYVSQVRDDEKERLRIQREDEQRKHNDNLGRFDRLDDGQTRIHERIDELLQR